MTPCPRGIYLTHIAYSDLKILEAKEAGDIIIYPFNNDHVNTSSYDVTLGEYIFREQPPQPTNGIFNIYSQRSMERVWGASNPEKAISAKEAFKDLKMDWTDGIAEDDKVFLLLPGQTILAHTNEFIGGKDHITTMMKARSSMGRSFIEVCKCAGWGDVGYVNRWTMEITNNSRDYTIPLVVGRRIAQIIFFETGPIISKENNYSVAGKYANSQDVSVLEANWKPEGMLPRLYKDKDIKRTA